MKPTSHLCLATLLTALLTTLPGCDPPPAHSTAEVSAAPPDSLGPAAPPATAAFAPEGEAGEEAGGGGPQPAAAFRRLRTGSGQERRWERVRPTPPQIETRRAWSYRRYRGTLAGQPLTLELMPGPLLIHTYDSDSRYFLDRDGLPHQLRVVQLETKAGRFYLREITDNEVNAQDAADWFVTQSLGPRLSGQRRNRRTGRSQPFELREDYTGAVRYEVIAESIRADTIWCDYGDGEMNHRYYSASQQLFHLLGPDTLRPALRRLQCPTPRQRHAALRQELDQQRTTPDYQEKAGGETYVQVEYNGSGILSVLRIFNSHLGRGSNRQESIIYDLSTGRQQLVTDWLRPDQKPAVLALLVYHARQHPDYQPPTPIDAPRKLPELGLDSEGVYCTLGDLAPRIHEMKAGKTVRIAFAALAPYVQPSTPLARLLRERTVGRNNK